MKKLKTQSNDLIIVEVPEDAYDFKIEVDYLIYRDNKTSIWNEGTPIQIPDNSKILGKLSELEDNELERFCHKMVQNDPPDQEIKFRGNWYNYLDYNKYESSPKQSFISLLQSNGTDINKELLVIEVL